MNWFDNEPDDQLLPLDETRLFQRLLSLGAMFPPKRAITSMCRGCLEVETRHVYECDDHRVTCSKCNGRVDLWPPFEAMQVRHEWLPRELAKKLGQIKPVVLLPNRVWRLAKVSIWRKPVVVYLLRYGSSSDLDRLADALNVDDEHRQIVLSTRQELPAEVVGKNRLAVALERVARLEPEGLVFGLPNLAEVIAEIDSTPTVGSMPAPRWFELSEDGSRLRVQGEELVLRRKQGAFVQAIAEAHDAGQARPKQSWVLKRSGYSSQNTSLAQICRRKEFARFIDWRNGAVAIRKIPLPKANGRENKS
ncbi:hypothetical protein [Lysobacter sp. CA199]|uniref:hypothetical protein n=1 Tax=Lysobacter sp. CA199 TaxID=3455608 RepID=UPI003F8D20FC